MAVRPPLRDAAVGRRQALLGAAWVTSIALPMQPATSSTVAPLVTSRARLGVTIGDAHPRFITVGLYGEEAPSSVALFMQLCTNSDGLTYQGSAVPRIERDRLVLMGRLAGGQAKTVERSIDITGYVRSNTVDRATSYVNNDANALSHDRAGLLSMRRGGGSFEFGLTPAPNPSLDRERLVVGEVLDGLDVLATLNELPTRGASKASEASGIASAFALRLELGAAIGLVLGLSGLGAPLGVTLGCLAAAAVGGDPRALPDLAYRPLTRVELKSAAVLD